LVTPNEFWTGPRQNHIQFFAKKVEIFPERILPAAGLFETVLLAAMLEAGKQAGFSLFRHKRWSINWVRVFKFKVVKQSKPYVK